MIAWYVNKKKDLKEMADRVRRGLEVEKIYSLMLNCLPEYNAVIKAIAETDAEVEKAQQEYRSKPSAVPVIRERKSPLRPSSYGMMTG